MHGLNLREMGVSDMLDVLHYMYEVDHMHASKEEGEAQDNLRENIYTLLYERPYAFSELKKAQALASQVQMTVGGEDSDVIPLDPVARSHGFAKSTSTFTQFDPTAANPFEGILDPPASHETN